MTKIKICGMRRKEDILMANEFCPDYVGFVFAKSPRQLGIDAALELKKELDPQIQSVGVFVNEYPEVIETLCDSSIIDLVQLHGDEDAEYIRGLKENIKVPVIKALRVQKKEQILEGAELPCDYLLLDTYTRGSYGGSGKTFDWDLIPRIRKPYFLAGGLSTDNVGEAVKRVLPYGVDVSSALETEGFKDREKVKLFIERVREYE
jgi:phosphoribosylanthranilate isomerase